MRGNRPQHAALADHLADPARAVTKQAYVCADLMVAGTDSFTLTKELKILVFLCDKAQLLVKTEYLMDVRKYDLGPRLAKIQHTKKDATELIEALEEPLSHNCNLQTEPTERKI